MAKIDKLKHKLRYNKDLGYQLTGKELKILIDYIDDLEDTITNNIAGSLIVNETITLNSDDFNIISSNGITITPNASNYVLLGAAISCPTDIFDSATSLDFIPSFGSSFKFMSFPSEFLRDSSLKYYTNNSTPVIINTTSLMLYSDGNPSTIPSNQPVYLELTYIKIA